MSQGGTIAVAIVEDDRATREGLRLLIDGTPGYESVQAAGSVEEALAGSPTVAPDVILLDVHLPGMDGAAAVPRFRERYPDASILMLTVYDGEDKIFESICNGADGYLLKKTPPARLLDAIGEARRNGAPMSPEIARKVIRLFQKTGRPATETYDLTPNEIRILGFLADGFSYQSVGDRLKISINTVRDYIRSIYDKLHVHSKSEAVSKALRSGLI